MLSGRPRACLFSLSRLNRDSTVSSRVGLCSGAPCWPAMYLQDTLILTDESTRYSDYTPEY